MGQIYVEPSRGGPGRRDVRAPRLLSTFGAGPTAVRLSASGSVLLVGVAEYSAVRGPGTATPAAAGGRAGEREGGGQALDQGD
jgi:hypothetical protein